ncbi:hypothetical protein VitviT2T_030752 [Vitis vinifera]|uniref:Glycosyltransferase n=2 Tax=Vitis vinifera TaxID=29760 RepID=D7T128_VITVI|eukprot:XP_002264727.1 PREDICTED: anthocyanidin 3-O-glucosyltransferase 2 [Vitis vinifera]
MEMKAELVFIPIPEIGHFQSMLQLANHLVSRHHALSVTFLTFNAFFASAPPPPPAAPSFPGIRFITLPQVDLPQLDDISGVDCYLLSLQLLKPHVKHAIQTHVLASDSPQLAGLVLDPLASAMIDLAAELGVASYIYFPSGAAMLEQVLRFPDLDSQVSELPATKLTLPISVNSVPRRVLQTAMLEKDEDGYDPMLYLGRRFREAKGIIVNTLIELEPDVAELVSNRQYPPVYPLGPLIDRSDWTDDRIITWLDGKLAGSVVFLCFGSRGALGAAQVQEVAHGLERSGYSFLWSLRQPPRVKHALPSDYTNPAEVLPDGFLDRTAEKGLVCGWTPQLKILSHPSIGGFISHGGWNSILESLWCGVPIMVWPMYAEQKLNACKIVRELGLGVGVTENEDFIDGRDLLMIYTDGGELVKCEKLEIGVKRLMDGDNEVRRKVKQMSDTFREAVMDGGSSFVVLQQFIDDVFTEIK